MPRSRTSRPSRPWTAPAAVQPAPPLAVATPQVRSGGMMGAIAEGMAFGGGSAVAHRAVDAVVGPRTIHHEVTQAVQQGGGGQNQEPDVCVNQMKAFKDCLSANANDIGKCQFYVDMLNECRKSAGLDVPKSSNW